MCALRAHFLAVSLCSQIGMSSLRRLTAEHSVTVWVSLVGMGMTAAGVWLSSYQSSTSSLGMKASSPMSDKYPSKTLRFSFVSDNAGTGEGEGTGTGIAWGTGTGASLVT